MISSRPDDVGLRLAFLSVFAVLDNDANFAVQEEESISTQRE